MSSKFKTTEVSDPSISMEDLQFITVKSKYLKGRGDICLFVPDGNDQNLPVVTLLHGVYGSSWVWALKGNAHGITKQLIQRGEIQPMVVAMPSDGLWGDGSAYFSHHRKKFDQWIVDDVPKAVIENIAEA